MAAFCIDNTSPAFKATAKKLGVSEFELEQIAYKYGNQEGTFGQFPSDDYIKEDLNGVPNYDATEAQAELWNLRYSKPREFDTVEDMQAAKTDALQYFSEEAVRTFVNADGKYEMRVGQQDNEYQRIKEQAIKNGTFLKVRNKEGKLVDSNLNERQWIQVRTKAFKEWFGDWENNPENSSKVVDENGEPMVVYHGGAPKISTFRVGSPETTTTGYGSYTEEGTGREIPVDSARTIFFSSNPFVGQSYAQLYALQYFKDLRHKVQNMIGNLHDDVAGFSRDDFKSFDEFYDFLTIISEYNPRFAKLRDYIKELQQKGERLKPNEIAAARQLFIDLRSVLKEYTEDWNLVSSEWDNILTVGKNIIKEYLGGKYHAQNVHRLLDGEIPAYLKKEWELFTKIRNHREKYGLPQIGNYDEVHVWLSSGQSFTDSDYVLKYDGKELIFDETRGKRDVPISQMSFDEVRQFLQMAGHANQYSFWERDADKVKQAFREKSGYYPVFLNMRNPFEHDYEGTHMGQGYKQSPKTSFGYVAARQVDKAIRDGNDGVVYRNLYDPYLADNYGVFNPNQIKSATENRGTFSKFEGNIYRGEQELTVAPERPVDRSTYQYTRINKTFKETLIRHLAEDTENMDQYYNERRRNALVNLANALFDFFDREGFKILITNNPADSNRGSAVGTFNKYATVFYQDSPGQGGKYLNILHELLHIATNQAIPFDWMGRDITDETLSTYYKAFQAHLANDAEFMKYYRMKDSITDYKEYDEKVPLKYQILSHAYSSVGEFISCCISNEEVQQELESITWGEAQSETSLWQEIRKWFKNLLEKIFHGSSYLDHVDFLDEVTNFLLDTQFTGATDAMYSQQEIQEGIARHEEIWNNAREFAKPQQAQSQQTIDIWAGSNPTNADLSNMAQRPFTYNGAQYSSIEAAFQAAKFRYAAPLTQQPIAVQQAFNNPDLSSWNARKFGQQIVGLDSAEWDANKFAIMKELIKESFKQNPQALQRLLATGDAVLTHNRERAESVWRTEFPRILMEVRGELRREQGTALGKQVATQGTTQQYGVVIDRQLKSNYVQWQQQNPNGLVAYRVNYDRYNTQEEADAGRIGNPFSEGQGQTNKGADTVQKFFDWLTTGNNFEEAKATEEYRQAIIQKLLNTPVGTPILYYMELGRPSHATVLGYLINHKELIGGQQITTAPKTKSQEEPLWAPPKVERDFHEREVTVVTQMDNLTKSGILTTTEIVDEANKAMDWISDQLTQYLEDPSIVWDKLDDTKKEGTTREEVIAKVSQMSRKELLEYIGVSNIIRFYTEEVLSLVESDEAAGIVGNEDIFGSFEDSDYEKLDLIKENISGLIQYGHTRFLAREGFGFQISDVKGEDYVVTEVDTENVIDVDNFNVPEDVVEEVGNQQEYWMIESATRDIMANASVQVKQAIADCFILEDNGKVNPDGTIAYDIAKDKLNRNKRVDPVKAVRSIVRWTQGALTVSQMIDKLSVKAKGNPWVSQIVSRLQDTSGKESDFQSQFFNTFCKHFQAYSIVKRRADGTYYTMLVNVHPALNEALNNIIIQHKTGGFALVTEEGKVVSSNLETFRAWVDTLESFGNIDEDNREGVIDMISNILYAIGLPQSPEDIARILDNKVKNTVWENAINIWEKLNSALKDNAQDYNPFEFGNAGIRNYVKQLIQPFTNALEDTMVSAVFDGGKMYQSNITPSWTTKLFQKMHLPDREFKEFVLSEFGSSEWFIDPKVNMLEELPENAFEGLSEEERDQLILETKVNYIESHPNIWRLPWLGSLINMTEEQRQEVFQHKVQLNFDQQRYMKGMDAPAYVLSCFTEYFGESSTGRDSGAQYANFRFPMLSNKPSNEFVRFLRYSDIGTRDFLGEGAKSILKGYYKIFLQEISRIQTVEMRNLKEGDEGYIANFDANEGKGSGLKFNFLDYLNKYLNGSMKDTALGKLIDRKLHAENEAEALSAEEERTLEGLVRDEIAKHLFDVADRLIAKYKETGVFEALKNIEGIDNSDYGVQAAITEFAWNDNFAQANLLELLVTDKAFYKDEEDLQKRLAQVHSPGIRGNWEALDFGDEETGRAPERISDGKLRVVKLADFLAVKDSITENLTAIFNKKIEEAYGDEKQALEDLRDNIIKAYEEINVVDGQAFVSPTAYRKHAFAFGEWTREDEKVYKRLLNGEFNLADIQRVFNPRKPFTYGKTTKRSDPSLNTPIKNLRYGVQYKNSEYLLILADAIMRGQETQRPNILGAIFDVMEESYKTDPKEGIDFIIFESGVKTGLMGAISLNDFVDNPDGRALAYKKLIDNIYQNGQHSAYNEDYVDVLDSEDYTEQQVVPEHFMHGSLQWGSQIRAMMPSDLETVYDGQDVVYEYKDPATGETIKESAEEIRRAWEENTAKMVNLSIAELKKELGLDGSMSIADSNVVISKILQREILSNPRYGVDLLLACSVDAEGNFRIPLGDPIQSKRVEQLLSSIVKNRINKQKVAGGTLVEVTNFGTSKRLNIRFKDKSDPTGKKLLDTRAEYLAKGHTEDEFKEYVKNNQGGIAHYECYAPAWARELFLKFADEKGNIDVEAIEMLDPDLLKMFGYRIPTEDKYSTAPYKIVGFLPKEAGDGFMQPWETTVIDGSDFDVDKKNLMRMALEIKSSLLSKKEFYEKNGILENSEEAETKYRNYRRKAVSAKTILERIGDSGDISLSASEREEAEWYAESRKNRRLDDALISKYNAEDEAVEDSDRDDSLVKVHKSFAGNEIEYQSLQDTIDMLEAREELTSEDEKRIKRYKAKLKRIDAKYSERQQVIDRDYSRDKEGAVKSAKREKKRAIIGTILQEGIFRDSSTIPANQRPLFLAVKKAYIEAAFKVEKPKAGTKDYYNNLMFNMQWAIATHASTADKMLNPGNFDPQKKMGYMVEAHRMGYDWGTLQKMKIKDMKALVSTSKNLMDFDVQTQFYSQNAVAGQILGIFAVAKSAHAMFESRNYGVVVNRTFFIDGMKFGGIMRYDQKYDRKGNLIGKTIGSLVGASADAVKDPVLNLMNINKETVNVLNTALRLGMDFDTVALLLSTKVVTNVLNAYRRNSLIAKTSFDAEIKKSIRELEKNSAIGKDSPLQQQNLTIKDMVDAVNNPTMETAYKILNALRGLSEISKTAQPLTDLSRLNSITSAPGPLYINTISSDRKVGPQISMDGIVKIRMAYKDATDTPVGIGSKVRNDDIVGGEYIEITDDNLEELLNRGTISAYEEYEDATREMVFDELPSLRAFYESYNIVKDLFKKLNFTTASAQFQKVLDVVPDALQFTLYNNDKLLSNLADFFQSYLLVQSGAIKHTELHRYVTEFVSDYMKGKLTADEKVKNNPLIQAIQPKLISKKGEPDRYALSIDTTGMEQSEKDALSAGWTQLEKDDPELSHKLFAYNFFRGGIGFNPKTFMALVPIQVKESIGNYIETFTILPAIDDAYSVFDQWVRNNWGNTDLVTKVTDKACSKETTNLVFTGKELYKVYNSPYIRVVTKEGDFMFRETSRTKDRVEYTKVTPLGNNKEYLEMFPTNVTNTTAAVFDNMQRGRASLEAVESDIAEQRTDSQDDFQTVEEQSRELADFYQDVYGKEDVEESERAAITDSFEKANTDLEIQTDESKFEEILDQFC